MACRPCTYGNTAYGRPSSVRGSSARSGRGTGSPSSARASSKPRSTGCSRSFQTLMNQRQSAIQHSLSKPTGHRTNWSGWRRKSRRSFALGWRSRTAHRSGTLRRDHPASIDVERTGTLSEALGRLVGVALDCRRLPRHRGNGGALTRSVPLMESLCRRPLTGCQGRWPVVGLAKWVPTNTSSVPRVFGRNRRDDGTPSNRSRGPERLGLAVVPVGRFGRRGDSGEELRVSSQHDDHPLGRPGCRRRRHRGNVRHRRQR